MHRIGFAIALAACGGGAPTSSTTPTATTTTAPVAPDATPIDAPTPDAGPSAAVLAAPPWSFRYHAADRDETWTLRYAGGEALVTVDSARGTTKYAGTANDTPTVLLLALTAGATQMALECKRDERAIGKACNDKLAKKRPVLDCYHPDFQAPMTFASEPGAEFDVAAGCYKLRAAN